MTTLTTLIATVSTKVGDPSNTTFVAATVTDFINAAIMEIGRLAPKRFQEDVVPVANTLVYQLQSSSFSVAQPEIEVVRCELWDKSTTPDRFLTRLTPAASEYENSSRAGWRMWNGSLEIPNSLLDVLDVTIHLIRVWGYRPYKQLASGSDVSELSSELEAALLSYARIQALEMLNSSRDLYSQWQAQANNTDVSPAGLINALSEARDDWRRKAKAITVLRERA